MAKIEKSPWKESESETFQPSVQDIHLNKEVCLPGLLLNKQQFVLPIFFFACLFFILDRY